MIVVFIAVPVILLVVLYYLFPILKIEGDSMYPTLKEGDYLLATRVFNRYGMKKGHIYVFRSPADKNRYLIKRLTHECECAYNGPPWRIQMAYFFVGDNLGDSYDSRNFGWVDQSAIIAEVIFPKKLLTKGDTLHG